MIRKLLGADGLGGGDELSIDELGSFLRSEYIAKKEETDRRDRARLLGRYYAATGETEIEKMIGEVFKDKEVISKRTEWVKRAKYNNVIRRVVHEKSSLYTEPARRSVAEKAGNDRYHALLKKCGFDQVMLRASRLLMLHWTIAIGFRIRELEDGSLQPVVDLVTPDRFWAISHPADRSRLVAIVIEMDYCGPRMHGAGKYLVWTHREYFRMTATGHVMVETWKDNPFGRMPYVLASLDPPGTAPIIADNVNEDLRAAHEAVWFENVCLLKESKSATKLLASAGDMTTSARGQASDSEGMINLPEGAIVTTIDMSMDLGMFRDTAESIYDSAATNHGLATSIRKNQGIQSGDARDLLRVPLREVRNEMAVPMRSVEHNVAENMSIVCTSSAPEFAFSMEDWKCDFGEAQTPRGAKEANEIFEHERRLGLTSTAKEKVKRNPDLTVETAQEEIAEDVVLEQERIELMKPLMVASGEAQGNSRFPAPGDAPRSGPPPNGPPASPAREAA